VVGRTREGGRPGPARGPAWQAAAARAQPLIRLEADSEPCARAVLLSTECSFVRETPRNTERYCNERHTETQIYTERNTQRDPERPRETQRDTHTHRDTETQRGRYTFECMRRHQAFTLPPANERVTHASTCIRRHQAFALAPVVFSWTQRI